MEKLSKREKILMYIAFIMAIFCFGYYLFLLPSKAAYTEIKASYSDAVSMKNNKGMLLHSEASFNGAFERGKEYYLTHQGEFGDSIDTVRLEQKVLSYMDQYEIDPVSTKAIEVQTVEDNRLLLKTSIIVSASGTWDHIFQMFDEMGKEKGLYVSSFQLNFLSDMELYHIEFTVDYYMAEEQTISWEDIS